MLQRSQKFAVTVIVLVIYMMTLVGQGFAQDSGIKLVMNPSKTDVYLGSDPIALTARVKGKNLAYEWKLLGPGKLEGKGSSVFYILPDTIEGESEQALITVTRGTSPELRLRTPYHSESLAQLLWSCISGC